jgi:proteic killer suppression protein
MFVPSLAPGDFDKRRLSVYVQGVIRTFRHRGLKRLWEGDTSRVNAALRERLENILAVLDAAAEPADVNLPGYRLDRLKGDLRGVWSVTVSGNWRVNVSHREWERFRWDLPDYH